MGARRFVPNLSAANQLELGPGPSERSLYVKSGRAWLINVRLRGRGREHGNAFLDLRELAFRRSRHARHFRMVENRCRDVSFATSRRLVSWFSHQFVCVVRHRLRNSAGAPFAANRPYVLHHGAYHPTPEHPIFAPANKPRVCIAGGCSRLPVSL